MALLKTKQRPQCAAKGLSTESSSFDVPNRRLQI
uniref:Uncharacterized protein n=1 Tax=Anguilla anguilla TaxID=7936 RepID=A0A0E9V4Z3_ANGAN